MRHPRRDELWDRTPGGVIVPRRVGLPTRRFIGKLGMVVDCCETSVQCSDCPYPEEFILTIAGFTANPACSALNDTWTVPHIGTQCDWELDIPGECDAEQATVAIKLIKESTYWLVRTFISWTGNQGYCWQKYIGGTACPDLDGLTYSTTTTCGGGYSHQAGVEFTINYP